MYLHNVPSNFGRLVSKPESAKSRQLLYDDNVSVQDQIENFRVKISLKERYNKVLKDEMEETRQGATTVINDLYEETKALRTQFGDALELERTTVQKALRTHRNFRLTLRKQIAGEAVDWLDNKLFDITKQLNSILSRLHCKRRKLMDVEQVVVTLDKYPKPGTLPWEIEATEAYHQIEIKIEKMKVQLESASILHSKYCEIKFILKAERGKYAPVLTALDSQLRNQRKELAQLQKMSADAAVFQTDAAKKLQLTEQEAIENRRKRRKQMIKMKKAVERILQNTQNSAVTGVIDSLSSERMSLEEKGGADLSYMAEQDLRIKKKEVEIFQERTRRLVDAMKVPDLTHIPIRYQTVFELGVRFEREQTTKESLRDALLRQQNMLNLMLCHFLYTGQREAGYFNDEKNSLELKREQIQTSTNEHMKTMQTYGELTVDVRLSMLTLIERFEIPAKQRKRFRNSDLRAQIKTIQKKVIQLVTSVEDLEKEMQEDEDESKQALLYIRPTTISPRLLRVGTPDMREESDAEEEFADMKVPGRKEIKAKSLKFLNHAKLKRGIH